MCASNQPRTATTRLSQTAHIEISTTAHPEVKPYPLTQTITNIGRDVSSDIIIQDDIVSTFHFQIEQRNGLYRLRHPHPSKRETANGFLYKGRHYKGYEPFDQPCLRNGDTIRIGDGSGNGTLVTIVFYDGSDDLNIQGIVPNVRSVPLGAPSFTLGRDPSSDIRLDHPQVSWNHARLERTHTGYRIVDRGSTNHTYVNNTPMSTQLLVAGDVVRIGPFKFTYTDSALEQYDESKSIRIEAHNLTKYFKGTIALDNISLVIPPQKFVALVGGSGAGKSTLLNALSGFLPADSGQVFYNDTDYYQSLAAFRTQLGYVPQKDIVHKELTIESALYYGAKLRLPSDYTEQQIENEIDEVLGQVELKHHRIKRVSKLSGGQLKRVSIALELLAKPSVFFLDEPTSGLDPGLDRKMMMLLRKLADSGKTIVLVTHATENIDLCDYVCFLAKGGRMAYFGPPQKAKAFFNKANFAEIYGALEPVSTAKSDEVEQFCIYKKREYESSVDYKTYISTQLKYNSSISGRISRPVKSGNMVRQFYWLCRRYTELLLSDRGNTLILLGQSLVIAVILCSFIYWGVGQSGFKTDEILLCPHTAQMLTSDGFPDIPGQQFNSPHSFPAGKKCSDVQHFLQKNVGGKHYAKKQAGVMQALQNFIVPGEGDAPTILFIMAFAAVMFGCINASREIVKEQEIYKREQAVSVGTLPYIFSKVLVLSVLCLVQSAILVGAVAWVDPMQHGTIFPGMVEIYITIALTSLAGLMMGLAVSAMVPNNDWAMSILPLLLLPQVIFSGTLFQLKGWFLQVLGALFPIRWSMAAMGSSVGLHSDKLNNDTLFGTSYATYHSTLLSTYSSADATQHLEHMWLALLVMIVLFGFIVWLSLKLKYGQLRIPRFQSRQQSNRYASSVVAQTPFVLPKNTHASAPVGTSASAPLQYCPNCNVSLRSSALYCRNCGGRVR